MLGDKRNDALHDSRIRVTLIADILPRKPVFDQFADCDCDCDLPMDCDCDCACSDKITKPVTLAEPISFYLELTPYCPNHCQGCGNVFVDRRFLPELQRPLSLSQWQAVLEKIHPPASFLRLTGGEPTLHPDFLQIIRKIDEYKIPFALLTTGRWRNRERILNELRHIESFKGFLISLHGPTADIHEIFTGSPGSFDDAVDSIRVAAEMGFNVAVSTVMLNSNYKFFEETVHKARSVGANHIVFGRYIGESIPGLTLSTSELHEAISEVARLEAGGYPVRFGNCIPQCFEPSTSAGCTAGQTFCTIDPWGNMRPCNHSPLVVGNLLNSNLDEIWHSEKMLAWRDMYNEECLSCAAFGQCRGGCKVTYNHMNHDPLMVKAFDKFNPIINPQEIQLPSSAIPHGEFALKKELNGNVIVAKGRAVYISSYELDLLNSSIGKLTLQDIQHQSGNDALSYFGKLFVDGFISLR